MKPKLALVTQLYQSNARQIPEMLRKLAGEIESPPVPGSKADQALCIIRDSSTGQLNIYGWGDVDVEDSITMALIAQRKLSVLADGGTLWELPSVPASTPPDVG